MTNHTTTGTGATSEQAQPNIFSQAAAPVVSESIKLERGMKGNYAWEIRVLPKDGKGLNDDDMERLREINNKMMSEYGAIQ